MHDDIQFLQMSIFRLTERYIDRQKVIGEAFRALRPAVLETALSGCGESDMMSALMRYTDSPWRGQWNGWSYQFQGMGCRMIHQQTREIIEWEVCEMKSFDRYWFVNWIEWLWMFNPDDPEIQILNDLYAFRPDRYQLYNLVFPMLRLLTSEGWLANDGVHDNLYTIAKVESKAEIA